MLKVGLPRSVSGDWLATGLSNTHQNPSSNPHAAQPDYLAGVLLNQLQFDAHLSVLGDRLRWCELLLADRADEAMAIALQRLRVADVVSWHRPAITHSDAPSLLRAVQVPIHPLILQRLQKGQRRRSNRQERTMCRKNRGSPVHKTLFEVYTPQSCELRLE